MTKEGILEHHAYVIKTGKEDVSNYLNLIKKSYKDNLELVEANYISFGIDEARILKEKAIEKSLQNTRVFSITTESITREAQNALLKLLEDGAAKTHFIFFLPNLQTLLPTFKSRVLIVENNETKQSESLEKRNLSELLKQSQVLQKKYKNGDIGKSEVTLFIDECILIARNNKKTKHLPKLLAIKDYLNNPSASIKQILDSAILFSF